MPTSHSSRKPLIRAYAGCRWSCRRGLLAVCLFVLLGSQTGCQILGRFRADREVAPIVFQQVPDQQQLLAHLNGQAEKVKQLKTNVRVSVDGMPTLRGSLVLERPQRLRLKAGLLGVSEMGIDVGSNDDGFWVWTKASLPGEKPAIYFASHEAYQNSPIRKALPFDPAWIIDALGFIEFSPTDQHEGPFQRSDGRYEIRSYIQTPAGPTARISVVDAKHGWIVQQAIYDSTGRCVAYVDSIKYKLYPLAEVSLPQRIEIHVFQPDGRDMKLVVDADDYTINTLYGDPAKMWAMPNPPDVPMIDLAQVTASSPVSSAVPVSQTGATSGYAGRGQ